MDAAAAAVPPGRVVYAVGDLHGRADLLKAMLDAIAADMAERAAGRRVLVFLGDYVSRGPDSRRVVDTILGLDLPDTEVVCLKGNHEDIVMRFLDEDAAWGSQWMDYGGREALAAYGVAVPGNGGAGDLPALREAFRDALPPAHRAFLDGLGAAHREGGYLFVHAGVRPGVPLARQTPRDMMWIRRRFLDSEADFGAVVVHGHCVVARPEIRANRIALDTGAWQSGVLSALVLEGTGRDLIQVRGAPA